MRSAEVGARPLLTLPLGLVGDVVARPALVFAQRSHLEACLVATLRLQHSIRHRWRGRTAELAEGFWEGPETVFHAGEGIVCACGKMDRDAKVKKKRKAFRTTSNFVCRNTLQS